MKQTEIGEIPEDWDFVKLNQVANFGGGTTPARKNYARYYLHGKHNWVKTLDLNNSFIYKTSEQITDEALEETSLKKHPKESVLVAMYGGFNQIGRTGLLKVDASINQALVAILPKSDILNSEYLLFNLNFNVDYWKSVASSSRKDPNITSQDVKNYPIAFSKNLDEQKEIAQVLTDTDNLIQATEQLINKKQLIKTATMQNLLTGKIRLAEFDTKQTKLSELGEIPSDWDVVNLGNYVEIRKGETITLANIKYGDIPVIAGGKKPAYFHNQANRFGKTITISASGASAGFVSFHENNIFASDCSTISESKKYSIEYLFYNLLLRQSDIYKMQAGGAQPHVQPKDLKPMLLVLSNNYEEQNMIAQIFLDMDKELTALNERLTKLNDIKQGLMQNLLTGKIRLTE